MYTTSYNKYNHHITIAQHAHNIHNQIHQLTHHLTFHLTYHHTRLHPSIDCASPIALHHLHLRPYLRAHLRAPSTTSLRLCCTRPYMPYPMLYYQSNLTGRLLTAICLLVTIGTGCRTAPRTFR